MRCTQEWRRVDGAARASNLLKVLISERGGSEKRKRRKGKEEKEAAARGGNKACITRIATPLYSSPSGGGRGRRRCSGGGENLTAQLCAPLPARLCTTPNPQSLLCRPGPRSIDYRPSTSRFVASTRESSGERGRTPHRLAELEMRTDREPRCSLSVFQPNRTKERRETRRREQAVPKNEVNSVTV